MNDTVAAYNAQAGLLADRYERLQAEAVHAELLPFIARGTDLMALDVGAGSGRDAAWLVALGYEVVAAEPAAGMRAEAQQRHPETGIRWIDDRLPDLAAVHRLGLSFDLILLSAVWMHVPPTTRTRAFRKIATLLKPGGVLVMSLREGPPEPDRPMWPAPPGEVEGLARSHGLTVLRSVATSDRLGRDEVRWTSMCLRLPDDGAGALPLLRGIILNDNKSSTYKLGLLRAVARVADTTPALAVSHPHQDVVDIPLGVVALNWVRMYLPLVAAGLPQMPGNSGPDKLGFAKEGFRSLLASNVSGQDLRIGARFTGARAQAIWRALVDARRTIVDMPANYIRFPNSKACVFRGTMSTLPKASNDITLAGDLLSTFGTLTVPGHVWRSLQRLGAWIEPVLVAEWGRLVRAYGDSMGRVIAIGEAEAALQWLEPARDTLLARSVAERILGRGSRIECVWSGTRLHADQLDIDHCFPWSAWPCGDLWNLMPASSRINRHQKRDRLPSAAALATARERIVDWWEEAWLTDPALRSRFEREAAAALPLSTQISPDEVFVALEWRRLRLRQDQQVQEWTGRGA